MSKYENLPTEGIGSIARRLLDARKEIELLYIRSVNLKYLKDAILDSEIGDNDTILLNRYDFDNLVLEHRQVYQVSMEVPFFYLGVLIEEAGQYRVPQGRIGIIQNDKREERPRKLTEEEKRAVPFEIVYRCGMCGDVVDYDGAKLSTTMRDYKISVHKRHGTTCEKTIWGDCCKHNR